MQWWKESQSHWSHHNLAWSFTGVSHDTARYLTVKEKMSISKSLDTDILNLKKLNRVKITDDHELCQ
jgi:hypothetical protein